MKVKVISAIILIVMLVVFVLPAGVAAAAPPTAHATGGGWIYDYLNGHKVSFGFTAQVDDNGNIDGELQAVDHEDKIVVHGSLTSAPLGGIDPVAGHSSVGIIQIESAAAAGGGCVVIDPVAGQFGRNDIA